MNNIKPTIIYTLGSRHCGTTLLDLILDNHAKITGVGNFHYYPYTDKLAQERDCTCESKIKECSFWSKILDECEVSDEFQPYQAKMSMLLDRAKYYFLKRDKENRKIRVEADISEVTKVHRCLYEAIANLDRTEYIIDSSKEAPRAELMARNLGLNVVFLHLVRDGRGVTWSFKRKYGGFLKPMWWWVSGNLKIELVKRRNKNIKYIYVSYEKFCHDPEMELANILGQINLSLEPGMLDVAKKEHHQVGGNRVRFRDKIEIKEDLAWKEELPRLDRLVFNLLFGWLNKYYGY